MDFGVAVEVSDRIRVAEAVVRCGRAVRPADAGDVMCMCDAATCDTTGSSVRAVGLGSVPMVAGRAHSGGLVRG